MKEIQKWVGISGTWRLTNDQLEQDVRQTTREIITFGDGVVSGGALGVDYYATDEAIANNPTAEQIKIFLPTTLDIYSIHFRRRAQEGVITQQQAEDLIGQLTKVKEANASSLIENPTNQAVNTAVYYERNSEVVNAADELIAFQVNNSEGVQDTISKAKEKGIPVKLFKYTIN